MCYLCNQAGNVKKFKKQNNGGCFLLNSVGVCCNHNILDKQHSEILHFGFKVYLV